MFRLGGERGVGGKEVGGGGRGREGGRENQQAIKCSVLKELINVSKTHHHSHTCTQTYITII